MSSVEMFTTFGYGQAAAVEHEKLVFSTALFQRGWGMDLSGSLSLPATEDVLGTENG
jgi:hypothetical protein